MTLYQRLGVARDVSPVELKRAWRALAREVHPDRNPTDPDAAATLAEINAAYTVLSDPERRAQYDKYGEDAASVFFDPSLVKEEPAKRAPRAPRPVERGEDWLATLVLTPQQAEQGGIHELTVKKVQVCPNCHGTGWRRAGRACSKCEGGKIPGVGPFRLNIPPKVRDGMVLIAPHLGKAGRGKGAPPGDLRIQLQVPLSYHFDGTDDQVELSCSLDVLRDGGTVELQLPRRAPIKLRVRAATKSGQKMRVRGMGREGRDVIVSLRALPDAPVRVAAVDVSASVR